MKQILIVAHPRSGTKYAVKVCRILGLTIGHETIRVDGGSGWMFAAPSSPSWEENKILFHRGSRPPISEFRAVWHLVRNPLDVIPSCVTNSITDHSLRAMYHPGLRGMMRGAINDLAAAAASWVAWNEVCEERLLEARKAGKMARRIQVEDEFWPQELVVTLGLDWDEQIRERIKMVSRTTNRRLLTVPLTWEKIAEMRPASIWDRVTKMAERYRYKEQKDEC